MYKTEYLGDGVYASFDGYNIILDLRGQDNSVIYLEPVVMESLKSFEKRSKAEMSDKALLDIVESENNNG